MIFKVTHTANVRRMSHEENFYEAGYVSLLMK